MSERHLGVALHALGAKPFVATKIALELGDSELPPAFLAGASAGTASWGTAIVLAAEKLRREGVREVTIDSTEFVMGF